MEIIALNNVTITMTSREIANLTGKRHADVIRDVRNMLKNLDEDERKFASIYLDAYGREQSQFSLDKDHTLTLLLGYDAKARLKVIRRWQELEASQAPSLPDFSNPAEAARAWAEQYEKAQLANGKLEEAKPKIQHYDAVVEREGLVNATQVAQKLGMSAVAMNKHLEVFDVYNKAVKRGRTFKQWFIDKGLGEVKQVGDGYSQPLFTLKGEAWVIERLIAEGIYTPN